MNLFLFKVVATSLISPLTVEKRYIISSDNSTISTNNPSLLINFVSSYLIVFIYSSSFCISSSSKVSPLALS